MIISICSSSNCLQCGLISIPYILDFGPKWGGGYKKRGTYIEYTKKLIDYLNAWHSINTNRLSVTEFTRSAHSLHYYDSILVIEKRPIEKPLFLKTGSPEIPAYEGITNFSWSFKVIHPFQYLRAVVLNRRAAAVLREKDT